MDRFIRRAFLILLLMASTHLTREQAARDSLGATERERVVRGVAANLAAHYVDRAMGRKMAAALLAHLRSGDYAAATDGEALADLLTQQMHDVSHDLHLAAIYSSNPLPVGRAAPFAAETESFHKRLLAQNCMIEKAEMQPDNIGYLKLNFFADLSACAEEVRSALGKVDEASALIFDLRDCRGGDPAMVQLVAGYLFDHPEYWFSPREAPSESSWTKSPVEGSKLAGKPVYLLVSRRTYSGCEQFSYDLKMLRRATIVGETTGGAAHAGVLHRIDAHFAIVITEVKAVNPYSNADWEGVGVTPDVKVSADGALEAAKKLAESRLSSQ